VRSAIIFTRWKPNSTHAPPALPAREGPASARPDHPIGKEIAENSAPCPFPFSVSRLANTAHRLCPRGFMRYVCLVYLHEKKLEALSPTESKALDDESLAYDE
jgi:hypothetical protein